MRSEECAGPLPPFSIGHLTCANKSPLACAVRHARKKKAPDLGDPGALGLGESI
jgi:hypothetical protein